MHLLSQIIYSCKTLYMFRTVFPSIIRSSKLHIQQRCMSNSCCYLLLSGMRYIDYYTVNFIFIGLCIVLYSYSTTNKLYLLSQIIYSCKTLYMFLMVFPSIIRSSKLHIQQRYMSNSWCYLLLSGIRWSFISSLRGAGSSSCLT
jgi:hypothetical protein